jgi:outer membrane protein
MKKNYFYKIFIINNPLMRNILSFIFFLLFNIVVFSQAKTYQIGYLLDKNNSKIDLLLEELSKEINAVVGEDAKLEFLPENKLVNNFNVNTALNNYNKLINGKTDIIIAFGAVNNLIISKLEQYKKPTILFGNLNEDLLGKFYSEQNAPKENFTYIVNLESYEDDLIVLKKLVAPSNVGVFIEKSFSEYKDLRAVFDGYAKDLNLNLSLKTFETVADITNNLEDLDAIYLVGGIYFSSDDLRQLANVLIDKRIPSLTTLSVDDVLNGLLATNTDGNEITQFFRRIALSVESYVVNNAFEETSSLLEINKNLTINFNTANKLGIPLKYSLITSTNFVGDATAFEVDKRYTLIDVMQEAINENLVLKANKKNIDIAEKDASLAKSNYLPDVTVSASGSYIDPELAKVSNGSNPELSTFGNITLNQTIFSEAANANITIQQALQKAQQENYNSDALNTVFNASSLYFNALILKANYKIQKKNLELTKRNLDIAIKNYEAGQSGKSDVLRFRSEMSQNMQITIESLNRLKQGFYNLNQILNNSINLKIDVEDAELNEGVFSNYNYKQLGLYLDDPKMRSPFISFLVEEAIKNAPELKALDYNLLAAERSERLYGTGRLLPTVALRGQYNYTFSRSGEGNTFPSFITAPPDGYYNVGLNVSLPLFNQNKQNINKQIASIQQEQITDNIDNIRLNIERNINDAVIQLINQVSNIELSKVFEATAKEALDLTQTSYTNGAVNIVQLLDAQNNYLQSQLASANATYNYLLSSMQLERYLGNFFLLQTESEREEFKSRFLEYIKTN